MVLRVLQEGVRAGGTALNYARAEGLLRGRDGRVCGAQIRDEVTGRTAEVQAAVVINATGAWADDLRGMVDKKPRLRQLRGSHLIFPHDKLPVNKSISFLHPEDRRPVFAFPWEGITLVGTTDVDHGRPMETDPRISAAEADYLMAAVDRTFGCLDLNLSDVRSTLAGIRSVLDTGKANPSKESRDEVLWNEDGLVTITGGKLTMFRHMAQTTLRFIRPSCRRIRGLTEEPARWICLDEKEFAELARQFELPPALQLRLLGRYGHFAPELLNAARTETCNPLGNPRRCGRNCAGRQLQNRWFTWRIYCCVARGWACCCRMAGWERWNTSARRARRVWAGVTTTGRPNWMRTRHYGSDRIARRR